MATRELAILIRAKDKFSSVFNKVKNTMNKTSDAVMKNTAAVLKNKNAQRTLAVTMGIGVAQAARVVKNALQEAEQSALKFETALARTNTVMQGTDQQLKDLGKSIQQISTRLPIASQELADATFAIASAGVSIENVAAILELSAATAVGALTDTTTAFEGIIAVIKGYGLNLTEATSIADKFFEVNRLGQTTIGEVASSIQQVTSSANAAGISVDELMAVYATFTGVTGNAARVTTQLSGTIAAIAAPTEGARKKMDELGISYGKAAIEEKGFAVVAKEVFDAVNGDAVALRELIPEKEALTLITALATTQFDKFTTAVDASANATGTLEAAVVEMTSTAEGRFQLMENKAEIWKRGVGKAIVFVKALLLDFGFAMAGVAKVVAAAFVFISASVQSAVNLANKLFVTFVTSFQAVAKDVLQIAKNIAKNIKAAFTPGQEMVALTEGTTVVGEAIDQVAAQMSGPFQKASNLFNSALQDLSGESANFKGLLLEIEEQAFGTENGLDNAGGSLDRFGESAGGAAEKSDEMGKALEDLEDAYNNVEDTAVEAMENVSEKTGKTLDDLQQKLGSVLTEMESLTANFLQGQAAGRTDLAAAFVEQEEKVRSLAEALAKEEGGTDRAAELKAELDQQTTALEAFGSRAAEIEEEVAEARRRAGLTDFERTIENIDAERQQREAAFNARVEELSAELTAIQEQKAQIMALEQETTAAITALRAKAASIYEGLLEGMATTTEEQVAIMIEALKALQEEAGVVGGEGAAAGIEGITGGLGLGGSTTNNISINITDLPEGASAAEIAAIIQEELTRLLQLESLGSS